MNTDNSRTEKIICPECDHIFEIKEYQPVWSFSDEGIKIQKAINRVNLWHKINDSIFFILGTIILAFFVLIDQKLGGIVYLLSIAIRASGIFYLYKLENKFLKKVLRKVYPIAFNS